VDQLGEETKMKHVTRSDQTLGSEGPTRPVICSREGIGIGLRPDAGVEGDMMRKGRVRSSMAYAYEEARGMAVTHGSGRRTERWHASGQVGPDASGHESDSRSSLDMTGHWLVVSKAVSSVRRIIFSA
jgi:hypothetical protein